MHRTALFTIALVPLAAAPSAQAFVRQTPNLPALAMSGNISSDLQSSLEAIGVETLQKPLHPQRIHELILTLLAQSA